MARRPPPDPTLDLERIRKQQQSKSPRARLRIMIAGDANRPIRTITLPRALPTVVSVVALMLIAATVILACGSWKMSDALSVLDHRVRAMVMAADSVALRPADGEGGALPSAASGKLLVAQGPLRATRGPGGEVGRFVVQSANTGEELTVAVNLSSGEVEANAYRRLRHLMRCLRTGAETPIDPRLIDLLYRIARRTGQKSCSCPGSARRCSRSRRSATTPAAWPRTSASPA